MEKALQSLMALQKLDTELGQIVALRGDLPWQVSQLNDELDAAQQAVADLDEKIEAARVERAENELSVKILAEKKEKYQKQLFEVKTNREYDAVSMEVEAVRIASEEKETAILELMDQEKALVSSREENVSRLEVLRTDFDGKKSSLDASIAKTETEEAVLREKRTALLKGLTPRLTSNYERILKAKNGMAVAPVVRGACTGCYTTLPPQAVLEVRQMKTLKMCETCGRMLVWDPVVSEEGDA